MAEKDSTEDIEYLQEAELIPLYDIEFAIADHLKPKPPQSLSFIQPEVKYYAKRGRDIAMVGHFHYNSRIDAIKGSTRVVFIVHGFFSNINTPWMKEMMNTILDKNPNYLVGIVGWGKGAKCDWYNVGGSYEHAAGNVITVGEWLAKHIIAYKDIDYSTYAIGHSLGSHVAGIAGRHSQGKLDRITGLDPAGPCFETQNQANRLGNSDAHFVDVIHTDGFCEHEWAPKNWICRHYGTLIPLGTIDFYPNNGYDQPGITLLKIAGSHNRSIGLFTWSIKNEGKFAKEVSRYSVKPDIDSPGKGKIPAEAEMGFYADESHYDSGGCYYLKTGKAPPYV